MRRVFVIAGLLLAAISCGDDNTTEPTPNPTDATITITSAGTNPKDVTINAGGRIIWVNNDSAQHQPSSDPHPVHTDCPGLNVNGPLSTGQSATSAALTTRRTCGYHDHLNDMNANFRGTITVQ